ncbi:nickel pincer cofactor biosynthesis protein LarB [Desulfovibrio sp. OttesenSCG-928-G11]|nr:nickel pincer cofactor biosynthesis protein LarB [Desulfovibrio sp. OttesenSCG-928-G11]
MEGGMQGILFDHGRSARIGMPEAVFCEGKSFAALLALFEAQSRDNARPLLFTRLAPDLFARLPEALRSRCDYHELSRTAFTGRLPEKRGACVAVVSAGTADAAVTWEAARTLQYLGIETRVYEDNGVAGLWRLTGNLEQIAEACVIIVIAGLDAALASVMGGLTGKPLFAVPTSVGYGMARQGEAALSSMLVSCAPGVGVLNIDNGYGAACAAARVVNLLTSKFQEGQYAGGGSR